MPSERYFPTMFPLKIFSERCFVMHSLPLRVRSCIRPSRQSPRPSVHPSLSPIPSSVRASVPLANPPRPSVHPSLSPIPLVRSCIRPSRQSPSSVYVRAFPTFDSHIAASSFNIVVPLAHERRLAGGDEWTRSGNESQPMRSCSLCAHAAYALMQPMSFIQDEQR